MLKVTAAQTSTVSFRISACCFDVSRRFFFNRLAQGLERKVQSPRATEATWKDEPNAAFPHEV